MGTTRFVRRSTMVALIATCATSLGLLPATSAHAVENQTVPGTVAPSWQTNGTVRAIAAAHGVVYIGGDFTTVRAPGAAAGSGETARTYLAAFSASTGALITGFHPTIDAPVRSLATGPGGNILYAGGEFTKVDNQTRLHLAAFSTSTNALSTTWAPMAHGNVNSIDTVGSKVYVGGGFSQVNNRTNLHNVAQLSTSYGSVNTAFEPSLDNVVYALAVSPGAGTDVYLAGAFTETNGDSTRNAVSAVVAATGANAAFPAGAQVIPPANTSRCTVQAKTVTTDATGAYFGAEGTGTGCFDGTFAANLDGSLKWVSRCLGATQGLVTLKGTLYVGSHAHDCVADQRTDPDAFPEVGSDRGLARHLTSRRESDGHLSSWYPNTNGGPNSAGLGPRVLATDGTQVFVGGEFTTVNGRAQQGFARFSPSTAEAVPAAPAVPKAAHTSSTAVQVYVQAPLDLDDTDLTIELYRDGGKSPIASASAHSLFWRQPVAGFLDSGLTPGSSHTYTAVAVDRATGVRGPMSARSASIRVVAPSPYSAAVLKTQPSLFYRLDESPGRVAADSSTARDGGNYGPSGITYRSAGATGDGDTGLTFAGTTTDTKFTTGSYLSSGRAVPAPSPFSVEAWVKTTSAAGGKIIGFGDRASGYTFAGDTAVSRTFDRHIYMTDSGRLTFGVWNGHSAVTLTSNRSYNDGAWHHVVGTQSRTGGGMSLFVDGARVRQNTETGHIAYTGYWRIGGDNLHGWPNQPTSNFLAGQIDDVAVYPAALSLSQVDAHYAASGRKPPAR